MNSSGYTRMYAVPSHKRIAAMQATDWKPARGAPFQHMPDEPTQSTCAPVALITGAQRAFSALSVAANSAALLPAATRPLAW